MKKNKTSKDQGLRLALQHRNEAAERMTLSADFTDRLMQRIEEPRPRKKGRIKSLPYWGRLVGATAAASVLLLLTLHYNNNGVKPEEKTVIAQQSEQQTPLMEKQSEQQPPLMEKQSEQQPPLMAEQSEKPSTAKKTEVIPSTKVTKEEKPMMAKEKPMVTKTAKPLLAQATQHQQPQVQPQIQPQPIAEKKKSDEKVKRAEIDLKTRLHYAELELEKATHKRQAAYEQEMKQRCLQLVLTLLTPQEEEREATAGKVRTQQS